MTGDCLPQDRADDQKDGKVEDVVNSPWDEKLPEADLQHGYQVVLIVDRDEEQSQVDARFPGVLFGVHLEEGRVLESIQFFRNPVLEDLLGDIIAEDHCQETRGDRDQQTSQIISEDRPCGDQKVRDPWDYRCLQYEGDQVHNSNSRNRVAPQVVSNYLH